MNIFWGATLSLVMHLLNVFYNTGIPTWIVLAPVVFSIVIVVLFTILCALGIYYQK